MVTVVCHAPQKAHFRTSSGIKDPHETQCTSLSSSMIGSLDAPRDCLCLIRKRIKSRTNARMEIAAATTTSIKVGWARDWFSQRGPSNIQPASKATRAESSSDQSMFAFLSFYFSSSVLSNFTGQRSQQTGPSPFPTENRITALFPPQAWPRFPWSQFSFQREFTRSFINFFESWSLNRESFWDLPAFNS